MISIRILIIFTEITLLLTDSMVLGLLNDTNLDRLVLSPSELARLVLKLGARNDKEWRQRTKKYIYQTSTEMTTELSDDADRLKRRKVWSRWGKWTECSVTCGSGSMSRERVCLEGRCAPGELEKQCRPCARSPCDAPAQGDDSHDAE